MNYLYNLLIIETLLFVTSLNQNLVAEGEDCTFLAWCSRMPFQLALRKCLHFPHVLKYKDVRRWKAYTFCIHSNVCHLH